MDLLYEAIKTIVYGNMMFWSKKHDRKKLTTKFGGEVVVVVEENLIGGRSMSQIEWEEEFRDKWKDVD